MVRQIDIDLSNPNDFNKIETHHKEILKDVIQIGLKDLGEFVESTYNKYEDSFKHAYIINDQQQTGEEKFVETTLDIKLEKTKLNDEDALAFKVIASDPESQLTIRAQNKGTGDSINPLILEKFNIQPMKAEKEMSKWYMNPKYHLDNFKIELRKFSKGK